MKKILLSLAAVAALSGCNTTLNVDYDMADLANPVPFAGTTKSSAVVDIEVAACHDSSDPSLDSNTVLKVKQKVSHYVPSAKLLGCSREGFNSFLSYNVPKYVGVVKKGAAIDPDGIYVYAGDRQSVSIYAGDNIRKGLGKLQKAPVINVNQSNSGNIAEIWLGDVMAYGKPELDATYQLRAGEVVKFTLNDARSAWFKEYGNVFVGYIQ
ncbi:hypothetical protein MYOV003v1_p0028 [Vibrio phage 207E48.1]|nr:hypothetical protein MYOV003v1_p0028 [Vibrio phage 207E48.1]